MPPPERFFFFLGPDPGPHEGVEEGATDPDTDLAGRAGNSCSTGALKSVCETRAFLLAVSLYVIAGSFLGTETTGRDGNSFSTSTLSAGAATEAETGGKDKELALTATDVLDDDGVFAPRRGKLASSFAGTASDGGGDGDGEGAEDEGVEVGSEMLTLKRVLADR